MALTIGSLIEPYEISGLLGAGGMGVAAVVLGLLPSRTEASSILVFGDMSAEVLSLGTALSGLGHTESR